MRNSSRGMGRKFYGENLMIIELPMAIERFIKTFRNFKLGMFRNNDLKRMNKYTAHIS